MAICLPEDMMAEILSWLPVKLLLRFRCVSKSWCSLISGTNFVNLQLKRASGIGSYKIILLHKKCFRSVDCETSSSSLDDLSASRLLKLPYPTYEASSILGSSNGLLCTCTSFDWGFNLWNPSTNEHKKIPAPTHLPKRSIVSKIGYGFGYDASNDDYKIILLNGSIQIFSLRRGTWTTFADTKYLDCYISSMKCGVYLNGVLHWPCIECTPSGEVSHSVIVSFGLGEESFNYVSLPNVGLSSIQTCGLGVRDGFLCLTTLLRGVLGSQTVWIMKEYGVSSSWTKLTTMHFGLQNDRIGLCSPLYITRRGKILSRNIWGRPLACFDIGKKRHPGTVYEHYINATVYVESLISPNAIKTDHKRK